MCPFFSIADSSVILSDLWQGGSSDSVSSVGGSKEFRRPPLVKYDELCALMSHMPANLRFPEASEAKQLWNKARAVRPNTMDRLEAERWSG